MPRTLCCQLVLLCSGVLCAQDADRKNCTPEDFAGRYRVVSAERNGTAVASERIEGVTVVIAKDAIVTYDRNENEVYSATFTLQPDQGRCHIAMKSVKPPGDGVGATGLIQKSKTDGTVKLIYSLADGEAPLEFKTKEKQHLFVLKRIGDAEELKVEEAVPIPQP